MRLSTKIALSITFTTAFCLGFAVFGVAAIKLAIAFPYVSVPLLGTLFTFSLYKAFRRHNDHNDIQRPRQLEIPFAASSQDLDLAIQHNQRLIDACHSLDLPAIRQAIEAGASVEAKDNEGNSPLHIICLKISTRFLQNSINIITYLLESGANPLQLNAQDGLSAFHLIVKKGLIEVFALFKKAKLENPQSVSVYNYPQKSRFGKGQTPLLMIIQNNQLSVENRKRCLEALLELGADPHTVSEVSRAYHGNDCTITFSTPLIALFYQLKNAIEGNADANTLQIIHATCLALLARGANPLAVTEITRDNMHSNRTTTKKIFLAEETLPNHELMNDLVERANSVVEQRNHAIFSIAEKVVLSQEEALLNETIVAAIKFQKTNPQSAAIRKLIDVFMQKKNIKAIECLVNLVTPETAGYAHLCRELANQYLNSATHEFDEAITADNIPSVEETDRMRIARDITLLDDKPEKQIEVKEYRRLCLLYCLKGSFSREEAPEAQDIKKHLQWQLEKYMQDWECKTAIDGLPEKTTEDILDITSQKLVEVTCLSAALRKLKPQPLQAVQANGVEPAAHEATPAVKPPSLQTV